MPDTAASPQIGKKRNRPQAVSLPLRPAIW